MDMPRPAILAKRHTVRSIYGVRSFRIRTWAGQTDNRSLVPSRLFALLSVLFPTEGEKIFGKSKKRESLSSQSAKSRSKTFEWIQYRG